MFNLTLAQIYYVLGGYEIVNSLMQYLLTGHLSLLSELKPGVCMLLIAGACHVLSPWVHLWWKRIPPLVRQWHS